MLEQAVRPGIRCGPYPQRRVDPLAGFDEWVRKTAGRWVRLPGLARRRAAHFIAAVEACEPVLQGLDMAALQLRLAAVKHALRRDPQSAPATVTAFALIREFAVRTLAQRPRASQIAGGWAMLQGMVAEMETGEGKSLAISLPAATAALAGIPVHVISVNDYLVERDLQAFAPLYAALGLSVGRITERIGAADRRAEYARDIVYCCNKQLVFDYLRDVVNHGAARAPLRCTLDAAQDGRLPLLQGLCFAIIDEADGVLIDECRTPLILSRPARAAVGPEVLFQALQLAQALQAGADFELAAADGHLQLSAAGRGKLHDLTTTFAGCWRSARRREDLVRTALAAIHVFRRDDHYLVRDGQVQIIDANTGRILADRSWELGLHQMIEAKEGCELTQPRESLARITYQRFFRRYLRLGATSGTAREVAGELWRVYGLRVFTVPSHRPTRRADLGRRACRSSDERHRRVIARVRQLHAQRRPVLIGTRTVASSERLSAMLTAAGLEHELLNARQDQREAHIVARAGEAGRITIATNMAGRGTDIRLTDSVAGLGGLHVIATELNDSRRIDRQLFGRCGRQGDPGSHESVLCLEDGLIGATGLGAIAAAIGRFALHRPLIGTWTAGLFLSFVQRITEWRAARMRASVLAADLRLGEALSFTGPME